MVMANNGNIDESMLELFVNELESHTRTLEKGLLGLENNASPQIFESLMRAAHSIKGAARIIGLNQAVELAHIMEDIFENIRKTGKTISDEKIQLLLESNDFYSSLLNYKPIEIPKIIDNSINKIDSLIESLKKDDTNIVTQKINSKPKNEQSISNNNSENKTIYKRTDPNKAIDITLLNLFKNEIYINSNKINELIINYDINAKSEIIKCLNAIKGASKIVGIEEPSIFVTEIENKLKNENSIDENNNIKKAKNIIDILLKMPDSNDKEIINYFAELDIDFIINEFQSVENNNTKNSIKIIDENKDENDKDKTKENYEKSSQITELISEVKEEISNNNEKTEDRFVKVLSQNLNRLLGLAGEITVQSKSLKPFSKEMQKIKIGLRDLNSYKEQIYQDLYKQKLPDDINLKFNESSKLIDNIQIRIVNFIEEFENFSRKLEITSDKLYNEAVETRMKPFSEALYGFPRLVRDISKELGKKVELEIKGENTKVDRDILEKLESPLNHLIRNAIDHGIESPKERKNANKSETGKITIEARHSSGMLFISISDNGKGIDTESLRKSIIKKGFAKEEMANHYSNSELYDFLFLPSFTTKDSVSEISGRGVGLDVVFSMVNEVGGLIKVESELGKGTTFQLQLPLTLSILRSMLVEINKEPYAIPISRIDKVLTININDINSIENMQYLNYNDENIGIVNAQQIFGQKSNEISNDKYHIVVLSDRLNKYGLVVDKLLAQPDLVVLSLDKKLGRIPCISSGAILEDGSLVLIIDVDDIVRSIDRIIKSGDVKRVAEKNTEISKKSLHILVVDDSLTVREVERKLLENAGYKVTIAVDGIDGWNIIHQEKFDLVISDIDMPRMNGIEMVKRIKNDINLRDIPVMIVSYKDREDDKRKGLDAGANYYLTKSSFHDDTLLEAVEDLIGKP